MHGVDDVEQLAAEAELAVVDDEMVAARVGVGRVEPPAQRLLVVPEPLRKPDPAHHLAVVPEPSEIGEVALAVGRIRSRSSGSFTV